MKNIFIILFTLVAFISYGQNNQHKILYDNNGKVLLNSAGTQVLSTEEGAVDGYNYTPNPEWIPVNGVVNNEIWILAFNGGGDRYSSFTCNISSSGDYAMDIIGGADGKTLLQTIDTASGTPINFQIPATGGKWCSSEGYYTFKLRIYAVNPTNNILTFTVSKHPLTTTTYNRWKIINFGTKSLTSLICTNSSNTKISVCENLLYANTYYCTAISGDFYFAGIPAMTNFTMPYTMDYVTYLGKYSPYCPFGAFVNCTALRYITMPISMNNLLCFGGLYNCCGCGHLNELGGAFANCTSLQTIDMPEKLNNLKSLGGKGNSAANCGAFYGCTSLVSIYLPNEMSSLVAFGAISTVSLPNEHSMIRNCSSLKNIYGSPNISSLVSWNYANQEVYSLVSFDTYTWPSSSIVFKFVVRAMATFNQPTLKTSDFLLTGTSSVVRSNLSYINIDWANSNFGGTGNIDIRYNSLSATELDRIFTALPTVTGTHTINVASNLGAATCTPSIATAKGWTVVTS